MRRTRTQDRTGRAPRVEKKAASEAPEAPRLEGGCGAPLLYFDDAPFAGVGAGAGRIVLVAMIQDLDDAGRPVLRQRVVAHLRGSASAFRNLRGALDRMAALVAEPVDPTKIN